jgi:hypothetical protein
VQFQAALEASDTGDGGHWVTVPAAVVAKLSTAGRVKVKATFNGVPYRGSIAKYGGAFRLGVTKAIITATGLADGESVHVVIELDREERTVTVPDDLDAALRGNADALAAWGELPYSHRREQVLAILDAKKPETRARRVAAVVERLRGAPGRNPSGSRRF